MNDMHKEDLLALITSKTGWSRRDFVASSLAAAEAKLNAVIARNAVTKQSRGARKNVFRAPRDRHVAIAPRDANVGFPPRPPRPPR